MTCKLTTKTRRQGTAVSLCQMRYQPIRGKDIKNSMPPKQKMKMKSCFPLQMVWNLRYVTNFMNAHSTNWPIELFSLLITENCCCYHHQETDFSYQNHGLTHHLSLPSSSTKMSSIEMFLQIQGSVPYKIRAKRGFATHPRSIAERVKFYHI